MSYYRLLKAVALIAVVDGLLLVLAGNLFGDPGMAADGWLVLAVGLAGLAAPRPSGETLCELGLHDGERERHGPFSMKVCRRCGQPYAGYTLTYWTVERRED